MEKFKEELKASIREFNHLLKSKNYFEAHEVLELSWRRSKKARLTSTAKALKGLINASIAFEHLKRDKPKSKRVAKLAFKAYQKYSKYIQKSSFNSTLERGSKMVEEIAKEFNLKDS